MNTFKSLAVLSFIGAAIYGYVMNLIFLFNVETFNGELVLRAIGVAVPPLGAILGFV